MPVAGPTSTPNDVRNLEAGMLLVGAGAILLFISLFLDWYQPGADAWTVFEAWDLVLALLALAALAAVASRMGFGPPRPASWLIVPAVGALVIVLFALADPPPAVPDVDGDPDTGLWLALASAVLMTAGAVLSVARISVAFTATDPPGADAGAAPGGRFTRAAPAPVAEPDQPVAPGPGPGGGGIPPTEPTHRM